jgi:hypothetical protein
MIENLNSVSAFSKSTAMLWIISINILAVLIVLFIFGISELKYSITHMFDFSIDTFLLFWLPILSLVFSGLALYTKNKAAFIFFCTTSILTSLVFFVVTAYGYILGNDFHI